MKAALASGSSTSYMYTHTDHRCRKHTGAMSYTLRLPSGTRQAMQMISRVAMPKVVFACTACSVGTAAVANAQLTLYDCFKRPS